MPRLSKPLCDALNEQIGIEISSAYYYLKLSTLCAERNLKGAAHWLRLQWDEELVHATKLIDYVLDRGNEVKLGAVEDPQVEFRSLTAVFQSVLEHLRKPTLARQEDLARGTVRKMTGHRHRLGRLGLVLDDAVKQRPNLFAVRHFRPPHPARRPDRDAASRVHGRSGS